MNDTIARTKTAHPAGPRGHECIIMDAEGCKHRLRVNYDLQEFRAQAARRGYTFVSAEAIDQVKGAAHGR